ncbi:hypothetical protein [Halobacillus litoralis]|uniref:Phage head morphogenesis domain-containing protein n=1 Tax=Halobacillus litoralis TaxID=45668 RepID=A0A410MCF2_9BACI|nr:hypothetical protein [Halobacillus litoralis]QAS52387.1 hypothetical protein HLI_09150 [Halobacillus litoralis]
MSDLFGQSARELVERLRYHSGPYAKYALEARKKYVEIRLKQDKKIKSMYIRIIKNIAKEVRGLAANGDSEMKIRHLVELEKAVAQEIASLNGEVDEATAEFIAEAVEAGLSYSQGVTYKLLDEAGIDKAPMIRRFHKVNVRAAEAVYARTINGLSTSDRIWRNSQKAGTSIRTIIQEGIVMGKDVREVARSLEKYAQNGKQTLARDYPNMMKRLGNRIPQDVSYEALRLARTEMTAAFGEGTIQSVRVSPSSKGIQWVLSPSHPVVDICDTFANADHGLGRGVYPVGEEPMFPPHPNCLCSLLPVHEDPDDFVDKLKEWRENPQSQPQIEEWYKEVYKAA